MRCFDGARRCFSGIRGQLVRRPAPLSRPAPERSEEPPGTAALHASLDVERDEELFGNVSPARSEEQRAVVPPTPASLSLPGLERDEDEVATRHFSRALTRHLRDDPFSAALDGPFGDRARGMPASTINVVNQVESWEPCPVGLQPMLDPVRLVHEDEDTRTGAPHIIGRVAANRWLAQDSLQRCPLCRVRIVRLDSDTVQGRSLAENIKRLASDSYTGGDNLAHKAVKCLDPIFTSTIVRELDYEVVERMLSQPNDAGLTPLELLADQDSSERLAFLRSIEDLRGMTMVHSVRSAAYGGSAFWWLGQPVRKGSQVQDAERNKYTLIATFQTGGENAEPVGGLWRSNFFNSSWDMTRPRWGQAVVVQRRAFPSKCTLHTIPILESRIPKPGNRESFDEEVFLPAISISYEGRGKEVFQSRIAARRGIWIGGTEHFDDFIMPGAVGAVAVLIFNPEAHEWRLYPMTAPPTNSPEQEHDIDWIADPVASSLGGVHLKIPQGEQTAIRMSEAPLHGLVFEPCFVGRRWTAAQADPEQREGPAVEEAVTPDDASRARQRLMLARFEVVHASNGRRRSYTQLGAIVSTFVIGRGEGCGLRLSAGAGVSRCHCVLELREDTLQPREDTAPIAEGDTPLVAYDDGSCNGTRLHRNIVEGTWMNEPPLLGVGPDGAVHIREGDTLQLGADAKVFFRNVSGVLSLNDPEALAAFYGQLGDEATATSLIMEPRNSERILSQSINASRVLSFR